VLLAAWITAKITRQKAGLTLDLAACALPLFMGLERLGEGGVPDFDISRQLMTTFLNGSFLTVNQGENWFLLTWKLAGIVMLALFPILVWDMIRSKRDGDTCLLFLLLFGACSVLLESLRYDRFLSISFVGLQQIVAAVMLAIGVVIAFVRGRKQKPRLAVAALISLPLMVGIVLGLEFALDRTTWNKMLLYAIMILTVAAPAVMGLKLLNTDKEGK
jgi:hypothetical protein